MSSELNYLKDFIFEKFNLSGEIEVIYSELDAVYQLKTTETDLYTIKCSSPQKESELIQMEHQAMQYLENSSSFTFEISLPLKSLSGNTFELLNGRITRIFKWMNYPLQAKVNPLTKNSYQSIGRLAAELSVAFKAFDLPLAHRYIKWNPSEVNWITDHLHLLETELQDIFKPWLSGFNLLHSNHSESLRSQLCYADLNDYNVLMEWDAANQEHIAKAIIDMGDMVYSHTINELAIACSYSCIKTVEPLQVAMWMLEEYHSQYPLNEAEISLLYYHIAARLMISLTVSAINQHEHPENQYLQITDADAKILVKQWAKIHPSFAEHSFRSVCGFEPNKKNLVFTNWANKNSFSEIIKDINLKKVFTLDLSIGSTQLGNVPDFENISNWNKNLRDIKESTGADLLIGKYDEVRPVYSSTDFQYESNQGAAWRTVHIGIDLFDKANTEIYAPLDGEVIGLANNIGDKNYGPTIILKHTAEEFFFFTLYGHLSEKSLLLHHKGKKIKSGDKIATIGKENENGNWPPHLHFQIILDIFSYESDFPGVCHYDFRRVYQSICPDPNLILKLTLIKSSEIDPDLLLLKRKKSLGKNLSLSYKKPLLIPRAYRQYLYDHTGRKYLDTVNNVAHCGHQHPAIIEAANRQMKLLNTNTRYIYPQLIELAEKLKSNLDSSLEVVYFTNSGSEANELAVRMARNFTQRNNMLVYEHGYHGNTSTLVNLSSYKFDGKGGKGAPETTHKLPMPDLYRGKFANESDPDTTFFQNAKSIIESLINQNNKPVAFLAEYILSCGGQVVSPANYFKLLILYLQENGIVYIADEVQTGIGRTGKFCSYEYAGVIPDIVTFGKPLGNGHPIGAVVCTNEIANAFNNGMEYFNTFGGNAVSCVIGKSVLDIVEKENYQDHATSIEKYFFTEFNNLKKTFPIISDCRGLGMFLGFECSLDANKIPATKQAKYLVNRMKEYGILMSTDGPDDNVVKIKPPMVFDKNNVDEILDRLNIILKSNFLKV